MTSRKATVAVLLAVATSALFACGGQESASEGEDEAVSDAPMVVRLTEPADGAVVDNPVRVAFEVEGLIVVPAGEMQPRSGHHHLLVDVDEPAAGTPVPVTDGYMHFGQGQTELELELAPGEHRLIALVGDFAHIPLVPNVADTITIVVR